MASPASDLSISSSKTSAESAHSPLRPLPPPRPSHNHLSSECLQHPLTVCLLLPPLPILHPTARASFSNLKSNGSLSCRNLSRELWPSWIKVLPHLLLPWPQPFENPCWPWIHLSNIYYLLSYFFILKFTYLEWSSQSRQHALKRQVTLPQAIVVVITAEFYWAHFMYLALL